MLRSVRDRFPTASLMVDANSGYTIADLARLRELDDLGLMMIEEPLAPGDFQGYAELQAALRTPVCLDESIGSAVDAERALELGSCRVINVKPGRVGGFGEARSIHDLCLGSGVPMWCGGMLESGVGRAHNVALSTLPGFTLPGDISASRRYWERDLVDPEWEVAGGALTPLESPGIGVEPDRARIEDLSVRRTEIA
jgi:O-succinylbenzoate synthase